MPAIKSAKKKLRQDKKRQLKNKHVKDAFKLAVKKAKATPTEKTVQEAFSASDKAAKIGIIHNNKAGRIKSSLSKLLTKKQPTASGNEKIGKKVEKKKRMKVKKTTA